ncbi:hypothetical protein LC612_30570 [Nostoc sp. CHAB 5834]|nr:hypothetical protein [Nostoc sp. CHAB 5834]
MSNEKSLAQQVTATVRAMRAHLLNKHKIEVPSSALRASYLTAQGLNPQSFASRVKSLEQELKAMQKLLEEAPTYFAVQYDFEGRKLQWLQNAGLVPASKGKPPEKVAAMLSPTIARTLFLTEDDDGVLSKLSLDSAGTILVPEGWTFSEAQVSHIKAIVPRISKYGLPDYLSNSHAFFYNQFHRLVVPSTGVDYSITDSQDDSGDSCEIVVRLPYDEWENLLHSVLDTDESFKAEVEEFAGLHYREVFRHLGKTVKTMRAQQVLDIDVNADEETVA